MPSPPIPLTEEQRKAAEAPLQPLFIAAAAGSGKTRTLVARAVHLRAQGFPTARILATTFSRKAAEELRGRLPEGVQASTLHAYSRRIALQFGTDEDRRSRLLPEREKKNWLREAAMTAALPVDDLFEAQMDRLRSAARWPDAEASRPEGIVADRWPGLRQTARNYAERLRQENAVDFDEILFRAEELFRLKCISSDQIPQALLIDEAQDLNEAQWNLIEAMVQGGSLPTFVGDPDQCIYEFRGASSGSLAQIERRFPGILVRFLSENFRSQANVVRVAEASLKKIPSPWKRSLRAVRPSGMRPRFEFFPSRRLEADDLVRQIKKLKGAGVPWQDMAILARTRFRLLPVTEALQRAGIPCWMRDAPSLSDRQMARLRLLQEPADWRAWAALARAEFAGFGEVTSAAWLKAIASKEPPPGDAGAAFALAPVRFRDRFEPCLSQLEEARHSSHRAESTIAFLEKWNDGTEPLDGEWKQWIRTPKTEGGAPAWENFVLDAFTENTDHRVALMTVHQSKGLEWAAVFLIGLESGTFPHERSENSGSLEESRLFYVALTRARDHLFLSGAARAQSHGKEPEATPSPFATALPHSCLETRKAVPNPSHSGTPHPFF